MQTIHACNHTTAEALYSFDARGIAKRFRHAAIFGALACFGYKLIKNSGWKLVKVNASAAPTPAVGTPSETAANGEKKETE